MLQGHNATTTIKTAGYGTIHIKTVPTSSIASLHENIGQKTSFACHDVPLHGHVTTSVMSTAGLEHAPGKIADIRVTKSTDGYILHHPCNSDGGRNVTSAFFGASLYNSKHGKLSGGQCHVMHIERNPSDTPVVMYLENKLDQSLQKFYQGACEEDEVCNRVREIYRTQGIDFSQHCLLALSPLTAEKRVVFSTHNTTPAKQLIGAMCSPEDSFHIKNEFLSLARAYGPGIYDVPLPKMDPRLLDLLSIDKSQRRPLWLSKCNKGMFVCDKMNNQMRVLAICKSRDFPGTDVDPSENGNVQVYALPASPKPCADELNFYLCQTRAQCKKSTPMAVYIPSECSVQLALMIIRNAFAQQNTVARDHHTFAEITTITNYHPDVMCVKSPEQLEKTSQLMPGEDDGYSSSECGSEC